MTHEQPFIKCGHEKFLGQTIWPLQTVIWDISEWLSVDKCVLNYTEPWFVEAIGTCLHCRYFHGSGRKLTAVCFMVQSLALDMFNETHSTHCSACICLEPIITAGSDIRCCSLVHATLDRLHSYLLSLGIHILTCVFVYYIRTQLDINYV